MSTYWVSTPTVSVIVTVDATGCVSHTAPYRRWTWHGKPWKALRQELEEQWGTAVQVTPLSPGEEG